MRIFLCFNLVAAFCCFHFASAKKLSIDQMIASATEVQSIDYLTDLSNGIIMQELDMVLLEDQWRELHGLESKARRTKRKAIKDERYRWTRKEIPYKIAPNVFSANDIEEIRKAIDEWGTHTCIRFVEATSHENYVHIDNGNGCYSYVGMIGGGQTLGLAQGCRYKGVVAHEIGHAVGFHHEQNRPDRDSYVRINRQNIPENLYYNFQKYDYSSVSTAVPYDYNSVMHYGGYAFSHNGQLTIETLNKADQDKIGNREGLSFFDIKLANMMYKCDEGCAKDITCPGHGFLGKDCRCYCPGNPVEVCDATTGTGGATAATTPRPETTVAPCEDNNVNCEGWANAGQGYCETNQYMQLYCKKACNICEGVTTERPCVDDREHCPDWADYGYCEGTYEEFMTENCPKSCEVCRPAGSEAVGEESGAAGLSGGLLVCFSSLVMLAVASVNLS